METLSSSRANAYCIRETVALPMHITRLNPLLKSTYVLFVFKKCNAS